MSSTNEVSRKTVNILLRKEVNDQLKKMVKKDGHSFRTNFIESAIEKALEEYNKNN